MYHLLMNTSIFVALPNDSFCQLVGMPITELKPYTLGFLSANTTVLDRSPKPQTTKSRTDEDHRPLKRRKIEDARLIESRTENDPKTNNTTGRLCGTKSVFFLFSILQNNENIRLPTDVVRPIFCFAGLASFTHVL